MNRHGDPGSAHLERAVGTWAIADEAYPYPRLAREKLAKLRNAG